MNRRDLLIGAAFLAPIPWTIMVWKGLWIPPADWLLAASLILTGTLTISALARRPRRIGAGVALLVFTLVATLIGAAGCWGSELGGNPCFG